MVDVEENYVVEENLSSEEETTPAPTPTQTPVKRKSTPSAGLKIKLTIPKKSKDVIVVDSGSESDSGNDTHRAVTPVEIKPDVDALNTAMDQSQAPSSPSNEPAASSVSQAPCASTPGTSAANVSSPNTPGSHGQSFTMAKSLVHRLVQTLPVDVLPKGTDDTTKNIEHQLRKEVDETKEKLQNLRVNVSELLKTILPEFTYDSLEYIDTIVVEMVRVNATEGEDQVNGTNGESQSTATGDGSGDAPASNSS